jgi:4-aminobutyrate aminotransferase-like enzyme
LIVADEVQCGFGRSGSHLWSFERFGIQPDLVTLGKPMGNGHPVAAVITRREIAQRFADDIDLFSTFGGNPVAARAGLAVLEEIERGGLVRQAGEVGADLKDRLRALMNGHDAIGDVRGAGLLIGVDIVKARDTKEPDPTTARRLMNGMRHRRVLVGTTGPHDNVLKIRPPLVLTEADAGVVADALGACLED